MQVMFTSMVVEGNMEIKFISIESKDTVDEEECANNLTLLEEDDIVALVSTLGEHLVEALLNSLENLPEEPLVLVSYSGMIAITPLGDSVPIWKLTVHDSSTLNKEGRVDLRKCEYALVIYDTSEDNIIFDIEVLTAQTLCQCPVMPVYGHCA